MSKYIIPKSPEPDKFDFKIIGAKPIPYNPSFSIPKHNAAGLVNASEQIIAGFLGRFSAPLPQSTPQYNIPVAAGNNMQTYTGNAMADKVFSNVEFEGQDYQAFNGQTKGFDTLIFNTVLITTKQHKNIVETNIQGSEDGAIFEYSGMGSYDVIFNIIIVADNQNGVYPQQAGQFENGVEDIIKMLESPVSIKVNNWYLQMLNIFEVVITDYEIGQAQGGISQQPITITARSNKTASLVVQSIPGGPATNS